MNSFNYDPTDLMVAAGILASAIYLALALII